MPAILDTPSEVQTWLSAAPWSDELKALIRPYEGELETYAVDRGVGKVQNDSEEFVKVRVASVLFCYFSCRVGDARQTA